MGRFLFIRGGAVGDFILTMPAIRLVREQLPDNEIEVLGYPSIAELALAAGLVDRVRSIEDARLARFFAPGTELDREWSDYFAGFDVVVSYLYDPDGFFAGNLERAGVKTLLNGPFRPADPEPGSAAIPAAVQLAAPLERFALFGGDEALKLRYGPPPEFGERRGPRIAIHPGSGSPAKNWSFESWVEVLVRLRERIGTYELVVTSGEAEHETVSEFLTLLAGRGFDPEHLVGLSLAELGRQFAGVDLYLGHDSGVSHLAASAGAEGLLLFGPTCPDVWAPLSPRFRRVVSTTGQLGGIGVEEVLEALEEWSSSQPRGRESF